MSDMTSGQRPRKQLLHLVFGGVLNDVAGVNFSDLGTLDIVGVSGHATAYDAWKGAARRTVDNARTRSFIVHIHRLLDPETGLEIDQDVDP